MNKKEWKGIKHFQPTDTIDKWGDPNKMDFEVVYYLDQFRRYIGYPIYVTSAFRKNDPKEHGKGTAIDFVIPNYSGNLFDLYLALERFPFIGIGLYRDWQWNGEIVGGFHVDRRVHDFSYGARWFAYKDKPAIIGGHQNYVALNERELRKHGVL